MKDLCKELLRNISLSVPGDFCTFILDSEGRVVKWSGKAEEITGYSTEEVLNKDFSFLFSDELQVSGIGERSLKSASLNEVHRESGMVVRGDGSIFRAEVWVISYRDERGKTAGYRVIVRDFTEEDLVMDFYRALFNSPLIPVIFLTPEGEVIYCNSSFLKFMGYKMGDIIGKNFVDIMGVWADEQDYAAEELLADLMKGEGPVEWRVKRGKEEMWVEATAFPVKFHGELSFIQVIIRDIIRRKQHEEDLKRMAERLEMLHELDRGLLEGRKLDETFRRIFSHFKSVMNADFAAIIKSVSGGTPQIISDEEIKDLFGSSFPTEFVYERLPDEKEGVNELERGLKALEVRSYITVPLLVRDEPTYGYLFLASKRPDAFNNILDFVIGLAAQLAITLHEAEIFCQRALAMERIEKNVEKFATLIDRIRNPLAIILNRVEMEDGTCSSVDSIKDQLMQIATMVEELEKGWRESENILKLLHGR